MSKRTPLSPRGRVGALTAVVALLSGGNGMALEISNSRYTLAWREAARTFALGDVATGRQFAADGVFAKPVAGTESVSVRDKVWGAGTALEIELVGGGKARLALFEGLPFVLVQQTLRNEAGEAAAVNKAGQVSLRLDFGTEDVADLRAMGTAGLTGVSREANPGSYAFLSVADPATRSGVVGGWLTHERGSGVVFSDARAGKPQLEARVDYGDLQVPAGAEVELETFVVGWFDDVRAGLEAYADAVARQQGIRLRPLPVVYCTWYHAGASDEKRLLANAEFAREHLAPYGFSVVQIDDGWQAGVSNNGPNRNFTTHAPNGPYRSGMKQTADSEKALGLTPGIWFMPFAGTADDPFFADKQDLFYQLDGKPYEARWGGTCLDLTNPKTQEYLRSEVHRLAHEWGYGYFKMDGLWTGAGAKLLYVNSSYQEDDLGVPTRHDPSLTPIEAYRTGLRLVREAAGDDVFFLGCCANQNMRSFDGAFGLLDAMRIGPDNGTDWDALLRGPTFGGRVYFLNKRVWYNDPDPVYVRPSVPLAHARALVSWVALTGQLNASSEDYARLPPERVDLLKRSMPSHDLKTVRPVDYLEHDPARIWVLTDLGNRPRQDVVGLFNWDASKSVHVSTPLDRLGLAGDATCVGFDFWANQFVPPFSGTLTADLPAASCRVLALRQTASHPQVVSTSRHITQGVVDLASERWEVEASDLTGVSRVVAGDPYELRLVVPTGEDSWLAREVTVQGVPNTRAVVAQDGPKVRVKIDPPGSGEVRWRIRFERGRVEVPPSRLVTDLRAEANYKRVTLSWHGDSDGGFRVTRTGPAGERTEEIAEAAYEDADAAPGQRYSYAVQSRNWEGQLSEPATVAATLLAMPQRPPLPPAPDVHLSDVTPVVAHTGWGTIGKDKSCQGNPLTLDGTTYARGMGVHAFSELVYALPKGVKRFVAVVGIDDEMKTDVRASVVFRIIGDVKEMGEQPTVLAESPPLSSETLRTWCFDLALPERLKELRLLVDDAGDGIAADHADWAAAGFVGQ
ncbi:MAG: hypothetical protein GW892_25830 [Armatimonadetes bacterium]|nr:hypothetical protein [Armatimonadota bacterium]